MANSFGSQSTLAVAGKSYAIHKLAAVEKVIPQAAKLPFSLKILLENLLRTENGLSVSKGDIEAVVRWNPAAEPDKEIGFTPARVLLQDFTGVPAIVDLAAMRDAMKNLKGNAAKINPLVPCELVVDHSVQVDDFGNANSFANNTKLEYERNHERYVFLRWGQNAFRNFKVVPPETGIVHQVNLEYLARVVFTNEQNEAYPDTLVGTDSHTTMVNGLGVLGWGVGGIEAEAAMLGQPVTMLIPQVVGFRLFGKLAQGATATDLVLTVTQMLRKKGVVGKFVEFYGEGLADLPLADRATIANMAPEYGATCGIFPVDAETLRYLRQTGRPEALIQLVEAYYKEQGMFHTEGHARGDILRFVGTEFGERGALPGGTIAATGSGEPDRCEEVVSRCLALAASQKQGKADADGGGSRSRGRRSGPQTRTAIPGPALEDSGTTGARRFDANGLAAAKRFGRHRGDHQLHQYFQSIGPRCRRPVGEECGEQGPDVEAVGEDQPRAGFEGCD